MISDPLTPNALKCFSKSGDRRMTDVGITGGWASDLVLRLSPTMNKALKRSSVMKEDEGIQERDCILGIDKVQGPIFLISAQKTALKNC